MHACSQHRCKLACTAACSQSLRTALHAAAAQVLDAPKLQDDFHLNLLEYSSQNVLAVGLWNCVYLWCDHKVRCLHLFQLQSPPRTVFLHAQQPGVWPACKHTRACLACLYKHLLWLL
jgi:hypothetical protein